MTGHVVTPTVVEDVPAELADESEAAVEPHLTEAPLEVAFNAAPAAVELPPPATVPPPLTPGVRLTRSFPSCPAARSQKGARQLLARRVVAGTARGERRGGASP